MGYIKYKSGKFDKTEDKFIKDNYIKMSWAEIGRNLNRRTNIIHNRACRLGLKKKAKINIGDRFGKLVVIDYEGIHPKTKRHIWKCQCDCGKIQLSSTSSLYIGLVLSCGCLRMEKIYKGYKNISGGRFNMWKRTAKDRNLPFEVTIEYLHNLLEKQNNKCALSGLPIFLDTKSHKSQSTASLDRIDSLKGYISENVQWVHKDLNYMKLDYNQDHFIKMCTIVANFNKKKK